jgi:hypothetical protein
VTIKAPRIGIQAAIPNTGVITKLISRPYAAARAAGRLDCHTSFVTDPRNRGHIARSCQNFPIQSSAAACFQLTGAYLSQFGSDIRLPLHDAYLINVPDDPQALADEEQRVISETTLATQQLFPGLAVKRDIDILRCFAKDANEGSFKKLLAELEAIGCPLA